MSWIPLIGKPTHFKNAQAYDSTACGYAGSLRKTDDPKAVNCLRCRKTRVWREARDKSKTQAT